MTPDVTGSQQARFDDAVAGRALVFPPATRTICARNRDEVRTALDEVEAATRAGAWAYGWITYEAGAGLDPSLPGNRTSPVPYVWFAVCDPPRIEPLITPAPGPREYWLSPWRLAQHARAHAAAVARVRCEIAAGNVYQVNVTSRARARVVGDVTELYADLVQAQGAAYNALVRSGDVTVISASPELFFEWTGSVVRCRPMKGTARRQGGSVDIDPARSALLGSTKDIAENVMIVDLVRNDLSRLARTGTVRVTELCACEAYGEVFQLSSTIEAQPRDGVSVVDMMAALFPSGSITGAPKAAAMRVIDEIEPEPRGIYCGAVGWIAPPDAPTRARFNVAIRTVVVDERTGAAEFGTGGGITIASEPASEYQEMLDKLAVLDRLTSTDELYLFETLAFDPPQLRHLERHLQRMAASARHFGFPYDDVAARDALARVTAAGEACRVRLALHRDGRFEVGVAGLPTPSAEPVLLALDSAPVRADSLWLRHKTSRRDVYESARARHPLVDDVILVNSRGEVTETTIANLAVRLGGQWCTPPLSCGLLPGIERAVAVEDGTLTERVVTVDDLRRAEAITVLNSLRGRRTARLVP